MSEKTAYNCNICPDDFTEKVNEYQIDASLKSHFKLCNKGTKEQLRYDWFYENNG